LTAAVVGKCHGQCLALPKSDAAKIQACEGRCGQAECDGDACERNHERWTGITGRCDRNGASTRSWCRWVECDKDAAARAGWHRPIAWREVRERTGRSKTGRRNSRKRTRSHKTEGQGIGGVVRQCGGGQWTAAGTHGHGGGRRSAEGKGRRR
jgi:hypothetical protein